MFETLRRLKPKFGDDMETEWKIAHEIDLANESTTSVFVSGWYMPSSGQQKPAAATRSLEPIINIAGCAALTQQSHHREKRVTITPVNGALFRIMH